MGYMKIPPETRTFTAELVFATSPKAVCTSQASPGTAQTGIAACKLTFTSPKVTFLPVRLPSCAVQMALVTCKPAHLLGKTSFCLFSLRIILFLSFPSCTWERLCLRSYTSPHRRLSPWDTNGRKSASLPVARSAPQRMAVAAIRQSASVRDRRPVALKYSAPFSASTGESGSTSGNSARASATSSACKGPQRNSAQATADTPIRSPVSSHPRKRPASRVRGWRATMRKLVSRWIISDQRRASRTAACQALTLPASSARLFCSSDSASKRS